MFIYFLYYELSCTQSKMQTIFIYIDIYCNFPAIDLYIYIKYIIIYIPCICTESKILIYNWSWFQLQVKVFLIYAWSSPKFMIYINELQADNYQTEKREELWPHYCWRRHCWLGNGKAAHNKPSQHEILGDGKRTFVR